MLFICCGHVKAHKGNSFDDAAQFLALRSSHHNIKNIAKKFLFTSLIIHFSAIIVAAKDETSIQY